MLKSIQQMLILALCVLFPSVMKGVTLSVEDAKNVAAEFFQSGEIHRLADKEAFVLVQTVTDGSSTPVCYVFNAKDGKGFVIVSADENAIPVIGYSETSTWTITPDAAEQVLVNPVIEPNRIRRSASPAKAGELESKLIETPNWSQEAPFNNNIPNRRLTGCVGIALAEIMKYHSFPAMRPSSLVGAGENSSYSWDVMRNDNYRSGYSAEEADAVAALVADAAVAIGTDFGMSSSSAFEVKVPYALISLFGYDSGVSYKKRSEMSKADWEALIVNEINEGRPVLYSGQDVSSGHAFVCDGYEKRGSDTYLHINWGWGGSANGYFASDALNPVVSRAHSYNDLTTIVYNIKPASNNAEWSPIHLTSDERQVGLTSDVADITAVSSFTVRAGALKNISNSNFSGSLAVALFDASGNRKGMLSDGKNFSLQALQTVKYVDYTCKLPSGVSVSDGDVIRMVTKSSDSEAWLPVAGDLLAPGEVSAKGADIPYFMVTLPNSDDDAEVSASDNRVIKGRDFTFKVVPKSAERIITVKANGFILTPDSSNGYKLINVVEDQKIDIIAQNAADVLSKCTLWIEAGKLQDLLSEEETATIEDLTLFGTMDVNDFTFIRDRMKLSRLDISQVRIVANGSNPANAIPAKAFSGYRSLKTIILPQSLTTFKNGCFNNTGLTSIEIPASVGTYEYNIFVGCSALHEVIVRRSTPAWVNWCVFSGVPKTRLVVPVGATAAYKAKEYWQDFKEIVEENPTAPDHYYVSVQEKKGLKFTPLTDGSEFTPGSTYSFKVDSDDSFGDVGLEVYANTSRLYSDAQGVYTTKITENTLLHVEVKYPEPTTADTSWKLTGEDGGIGLVTDVVNVPVGKSFTVRANAIKVPAGYEASKFFCMVLTDKDGNLKEIISPVMTNTMSSTGNITYNFSCQVTESTVREGNQLRLATSYNKKSWTLVGADADSITDRISAIGNPVVYHAVNMPQTMNGAKIEGAVTEIVRGMPFNLKVTPVSPNQRVTLAVNGVNKAVSAAVANVSIPSVKEDLEVTIQIHDAGASDYVVVNVQEGELAQKIAECPDRLKVIGKILSEEFAAFRAHATQIIDLDLSDLIINGAAMNKNAIPSNAFAPQQSGATSVLRSVILPTTLERINDNAFARCQQLKEVTIPASVTYVGSSAFSSCLALTKIVMLGSTPPSTGTMSPFPSNSSGITLEVPRGAESAYSTGYWGEIGPKVAKTYYWIKTDPNRAFVYNSSTYGDGSKIEVGSSSVQVSMCLPNCPTLSKSEPIYREGVPFKLYDNGREITTGFEVSGMNFGGEIILTGGQYSVKFDPTVGPQYNNYPQNHTLDLVFFYPIVVENLEGAEGVKSEIIVDGNGERYNATMSKFSYGVAGTKTVYKEGQNYKVRLTPPSANVTLSVEVENKIMVKPGKEPTYEWNKFEVYPDADGLYTIPELPGDTWVKVTGTLHVVEGEPIPADELAAVAKEDVSDFTELTVTGNLDDEDFDVIRDLFESVETIDLTGIENTSLPANAFEGMDQLKDVIIPETVTEIGTECFKNCDNIESLTLPGVTVIGEGAFDGCDNLTSILLPSLGAPEAGILSVDGKRKAGSLDGVTANSFSGVNPNCLIYVGAVEIPDAESLNIILNKDGQRFAASDIILDGNHPFNAPASFLLGDHTISFTTEITASDACDVDGGWKTIMLPFEPTGMEFSEQFDAREGSGIHLISFDNGDSETMTPQTSILPNRPYLANICAPFGSVSVTFLANAREQGDEIVYDVPFTPVPEETVAVGKSFSLYGSFDGETRNVDYFVLNETASAFVPYAADDSLSTVRPFSAYLCANDGATVSEVVIGNHPLWIREPEAAGVGGTKLYRSSKIELSSPKENALIYYTVDGSDPCDADGTRLLYSAPFVMVGDAMTVNAVSEYKGNLSEVISLNYELKKVNLSYDLPKNWTWISHNAETAVDVAEFAGEGVARIVSQTQEVISDPVFGLIGTLKELEPVTGYKVCVSADQWNGAIDGVAFDPCAYVKLQRGWNWIGCGVDEGSMQINDLFAHLNAEEGEMLVGLDGFVQVDAGHWKGTLQSLVPGVGYMYYSNSDKEFLYNIVAASDGENAPANIKAIVAADGRWTVDNHRYPSVMPLIASLVDADDVLVDADEYEIAAFCGDECRGIGVVVDGVVMINIHGNSGDQITFRFIGPDNGEKLSTSTLTFNENNITTFSNPYRVNVDITTALSVNTEDSFTVVSENGNITVKGDISSVKSVEVYDLSGMRIAVADKTNGADVKINSIGTGVVIVKVTTDSAVTYSKILVK